METLLADASSSHSQAPAAVGASTAGADTKTTGTGSNTAVAVESTNVGSLRKAMALRVKYREGRKEIPLSLLSVHPKNRGGTYPNGETVHNLCKTILKDGFSAEEAHHAGVTVQEIPPAFRQGKPGSRGKEEYETYFEYNRRMTTQGAALLKDCFEEMEDILYGALSHSHLLLVLRGLLHGALWDLAEVGGNLNDSSTGRVNYAAVAAKDAALADVCSRGLWMEVLSWKIYMEEPEACSLISQVLNKPQSMALRTTELTAVAVLTGALTLHSNGGLASKVDFCTIRDKVRDELDVFVDEPEFVGLFDFIINLGGGKSGFVQRLLEFTGVFVNPLQRRLRLSAFVDTNKMPLQVPGVKIAMIMRAYRKTPQLTWCPSPEPSWAKCPNVLLEALEDLLHYFHVENKAAVAALPGEQRAAFFANVNVQLAETFNTKVTKSKERTEDLKKELLKTALPYYEELLAHHRKKQGSKDAVLVVSRTTWICFAAVAAEKEKELDAVGQQAAGQQPAKKAKLMPTIIEFDATTGKPVNKQETRLQGEEGAESTLAPQKLPWSHWAKSTVSKIDSLEEAEKAAIMLALQALSHSTSAVAETGVLEMWWSPKTKRKFVTVTKKLEAKSLELSPCLPKSQSRIFKESTHPERIMIRVVQKKPVVVPAREATYYLQPEFKMPVDKTDLAHDMATRASASHVDAAVAGEGAGKANVAAVAAAVAAEAPGALAADTRIFEFMGDEVLSPYWAVVRLAQGELRHANKVEDTPIMFNMEEKEKEYNVVTVCSVAKESHSITFGVRVPLLTNPSELQTGAKLAMEVASKHKTKPKRELDWKADVAASSQGKKPQAATKAKAEPQPRHV